MLELKKDIKYIKGVGPNRATLLNKLGIYTLQDLYSYYPRQYEYRNQSKRISELEDGEEALICAMIVSRINEIKLRKGLIMYKLVVRDDTGTCNITWFNQTYLKNMFNLGEMYNFFGKVNKTKSKVEMKSPVFDKQGNNKNTGKIMPIYSSTYSLTQNIIRQIIENGLNLIKRKCARNTARIFNK